MNPSAYCPPFLKVDELYKGLNNNNGVQKDNSFGEITLPEYPSTTLEDITTIAHLVDADFWCQDLETIAPHLWVMSTQSGANINPLHRQKVKGREIVITEEPRLHLVWIHDRIFIKPLPRYILSHTFWETFFNDKSNPLGDRKHEIQCAALGFLRTYFYLIQRESDLIIAQQDSLHLVPKDIQWSGFCRFMSQIRNVEDAKVSYRYQYGELRLSRLNFYAPLFLGKFHFEQVHGQCSDYFARFYGPVLFIFAVISTVLNCMQIILTAEQVSSVHWVSFWSICRWFSTVSLIMIAAISSLFTGLWLWRFLDEWVYALRALHKRRKDMLSQSRC